jgi:LysR family hydrogen peroxide-inducible transcriptional activator
MSWPTFQQLRYLVAIADAGTFGAAADEEFVSQPALSSQIKELERKLGVTLFERSSRGALLTTQGTEVVERARIILR